MPGDLGDGVGVLEQPRLVGARGRRAACACGIGEEDELALPLERRLGVGDVRRPTRPAPPAPAPPARRTRRRAGAPRARSSSASASFRSAASACQRPRRWASQVGAVNLASAPPAFLATCEQDVAGGAGVEHRLHHRLHQAPTPRPAARRSSHRSSAWCCGQQQVALRGGLVEEQRGRDLERHLPEPVGEARGLGQGVDRVGVVHQQHGDLAAVDRRAEPGERGVAVAARRARRRTGPSARCCRRRS